MQAKKVYPTEWTGGHHTGTIKENPNSYSFVDIIDGKRVQMTYHFKPSPKATKIYASREEAKNEMLRVREKKSIEKGCTKNQYRFIDEKIIEVKSTKNMTFFLDFKNKHILDENVFYVKKEGNNVNGIYTNIRNEKNKKVPLKLAKIIFPNYKIIKYNDGNGLNLRETNLSDITTTNVNDNVIIDDEYDPNLNHRKLLKLTSLILPINKWILGKPSGTIIDYSNKNAFSTRIQNKGINRSKQFSYKNKDKKKVRIEADKWRIKTSYELGQTKNLIKIISKDEIHVQITKDKIFKTNKAFIPLIQKFNCCALESKSSNGNIKTYVNISIDRKNNLFHKIITNNDMTYHINGDSLDNRLSNLRNCTHSLNNQNRIFDKIGKFIESKTHYKIEIRLKDDYKEKRKNISIRKSKFITEDYARKKLNVIVLKYLDFIRNFKWNDELLEFLTDHDISKLQFRIKKLLKISEMPNLDNYMTEYDFDDLFRLQMIYALSNSIIGYRLYLAKLLNNTFMKIESCQ